MIGVDYELFWTLNPRSLQPFIRAFELRQEYDNNQAWLNGLYIKMAIASSLSKDTKYPKKPIGATESKEPSGLTTPEDIKARLMQKAQALNARFEKEG